VFPWGSSPGPPFSRFAKRALSGGWLVKRVEESQERQKFFSFFHLILLPGDILHPKEKEVRAKRDWESRLMNEEKDDKALSSKSLIQERKKAQTKANGHEPNQARETYLPGGANFFSSFDPSWRNIPPDPLGSLEHSWLHIMPHIVFTNANIFF
jgi:hypothetical protein